MNAFHGIVKSTSILTTMESIKISLSDIRCVDLSSQLSVSGIQRLVSDEQSAFVSDIVLTRTESSSPAVDYGLKVKNDIMCF